MALLQKRQTAISRVLAVLPMLMVFLLGSASLFATHNRAGEITYEHIPTETEPFRYEFTITTYTNTIPNGEQTPADRDSLEISWGDGVISVLYRDNGVDANFNGTPDGEIIGSGIRLNTYRGIHVYPGFSPFYVVGMVDPNRNDGINNINQGLSVMIPFYVEDTLFIPDPQFFGYNSSPVLSLPPIDFAQVNYPFIHNPTAFDPDGDSLHFELIVPLESQGVPVIGYVFPNQIEPGGDNNLTLDGETGELIWDAPQVEGEFNIAILITEYRNGFKVGTMIRDMQIFVEDTGNEPPEVSEVNDTCVFVGENLTLTFTATDDPAQKVQLTAFGAPFELDTVPATFNAPNGFVSPPVSGIFSWDAKCEHIFSSQYTVVIKAEDNFTLPSGASLPLTDLETWRITVVAPPPTGVTATTNNGNIEVSWDDPYDCAYFEKFIGFSVWRKIGCEDSDFDDCQRGLAGTGYQKIAERIDAYNYLDNTAERGPLYSYRVVAEFSDANNLQGFPINISESYPSDQICMALPKDQPILTNVSVINTSDNAGEINVAWTKPDGTALDTIINAPPYTYELYRSDDALGTSFQKITEFTANTFAAANDTSFIDGGLNTENIQYSYKLRFLSNGNEIGETPLASSVFLNLSSTSNTLIVSWTENVPWINQNYRVFRTDSPGGAFTEIAQVSQQSYSDTGLVNGEDYCYYVTSEGTYFNPDIFDPLLNDSQEKCGIPIDTTGPCPPVLMVSNDCITGEGDFDSNAISWNTSQEVCGDDDVVSYQVFYTPPGSTDLIDVSGFLSADQNSYEHFIDESLAGCYTIVGIDNFGNVGDLSAAVCVESCSSYELPNTFTPNDDSFNDVFTPLEGYRFVNRVEMKIFDRWGTLVFETEDPAINWDGTNKGTEVGDGVFYYSCRVFEQSSSGEELEKDELSGYIHLFKN